MVQLFYATYILMSFIIAGVGGYFLYLLGMKKRVVNILNSLDLIEGRNIFYTSFFSYPSMQGRLNGRTVSIVFKKEQRPSARYLLFIYETEAQEELVLYNKNEFTSAGTKKLYEIIGEEIDFKHETYGIIAKSDATALIEKIFPDGQEKAELSELARLDSFISIIIKDKNIIFSKRFQGEKDFKRERLIGIITAQEAFIKMLENKAQSKNNI